MYNKKQCFINTEGRQFKRFCVGMLHTAASIAVPKLVMHIQTNSGKEISTAENRLCSHTNLSYSSGHRIVSIPITSFKTAIDAAYPPYL
jgi:hypothetical protein